MEKLIVKNFGPIKEAEIDLTKYVVFIGDTSTGKSVLAKLIAIFRDNDFIFTNERKLVFQKLLIDLNINFDRKKAEIEYSHGQIKVISKGNGFEAYSNNEKLQFDDTDGETIVSMSKKKLLEINQIINDAFIDDTNTDYVKSIKDTLESLKNIHQHLPYNIPIYFPAERIIMSLVGNSISGLWANNVLLPVYFKEFAALYDTAKNKLEKIKFDDFNLKYSFEDDKDFVFVNNKKIELRYASSGIQSLIPMLLILELELNQTQKFIKNTFLIEEPELNLYPIKQKKIIEFIIKSIQDKNHKLIITTHSPYILSSLDTLILAKNVSNENPKLKTKINKIISEDKWIDYNDISVYEVRNDGKVYSIKNEEFKSIDANAIDSVSDVISEEFDKLTELRYAHKQ